MVDQLSHNGAASIEFSSIRTIGVSNLKSNKIQGIWMIPAGLTMEEVANAGAIICYLAFEAYRAIQHPNEQVETPGLELFKIGQQEAENRKREAPTEGVQQEQRPAKRMKKITDFYKRVPKSSSSNNNEGHQSVEGGRAEVEPSPRTCDD